MEEKVEYVLQEVFTQENSTKYIKRLKSRLRKSLLKDFEQHPLERQEESDKLNDLIGHLKKKFLKGEESVSSTHSSVDLTKSDCSNIEENLKEERYQRASEKYHQIYLVREVNCQKEVIKLLKNRIEEKESRIQREKEKHRRLVMKNELLAYRSKELSRLKVKPYVSPRSVLLVDSAVYSDFFGYLDSTVLEMPVRIVRIHGFQPSKKTLFAKGNFREVYKYTLDNGEDIILKTISRQQNFSNEKKVIILSIEAKIASLLSTHPNIIDYHGILATNNENSFIVQSCETSYLLRDFFIWRDRSSDSWVVSSLLRGFCSAVNFMHTQGVINNNLTHNNIAVRYNSMHYSPVILSLSLACKAASAKPLTINQQMRYEGFIHLPPRIMKGFEAPSYASDRYSVAFVIGNIIQILQKNESPFSDELNRIQRRCFRMDKFLTITEFYEVITKCCDELDE